MGIPGFYGEWLQKYIPAAVVEGFPTLISSISFDANGIIHDAKNKTLENTFIKTLDNFEEALMTHLKQKLLHLVNDVYKPIDTFVFFVDGVAPAAKLQQQRSRRSKAALSMTDVDVFDGNAITPGTAFMRKLNKNLREFFQENRGMFPPTIFYSSHMDPGEGEHKIMSLYKTPEFKASQISAPEGAHILYGLDADLIMLSLLSPLSNIYLSRENISSTVKIDEIKKYLVERTRKPTAVKDFVIMMFLIGNDFLPHIPGLDSLSENIEYLLETYTNSNLTFVEVKTDGSESINWTNFVAFLKLIKDKENNMLIKNILDQNRMPSRFLNAAYDSNERKFNPDKFREAYYTNAFSPKGNSDMIQKLALITKLEFAASSGKLLFNMISAYFKTMAWVYLYYTQGTSAVNQDWLYPYYHAPMLRDMADFGGIEEVLKGISDYAHRDDENSFTALHQLVSVIPYQSRKLVPEFLQPLYGSDSPIKDLLPVNFVQEIDSAKIGKNGHHHSVAILPMIDKVRIVAAVGALSIWPSEAMNWLPEQPTMVQRNMTPADPVRIAEIKQRALVTPYTIIQVPRIETRTPGRGGGYAKSPRSTFGPPQQRSSTATFGPPRSSTSTSTATFGPPQPLQGQSTAPRASTATFGPPQPLQGTASTTYQYSRPSTSIQNLSQNPSLM